MDEELENADLEKSEIREPMPVARTREEQLREQNIMLRLHPEVVAFLVDLTGVAHSTRSEATDLYHASEVLDVVDFHVVMEYDPGAKQDPLRPAYLIRPDYDA